jgi:predicted secreted protein
LARYVATDNKITINGTDFSSSIAAVTLALTAEEVETTSFSTQWRSRISGLKDATVTLDFHQDFGAASVDATLYPLLGSQATVTVQPTSGGTTSTNPVFSGVFLVTEYTPFENSVGDLATLSVTWPLASGSGITRGTGA